MICTNKIHTLRILAFLAGFSALTVVADTQDAGDSVQQAVDQQNVNPESTDLESDDPEIVDSERSDTESLNDDIVEEDEGIAEEDKDACVQEFASEEWLDKTQAYTYTGLCKTVKWFDGLFGGKRRFRDEQFGGKIQIGFKQREDEGFDEKVRIRIKTKLPNLSSKANAFIGRVDETEYVTDSDQGPGSLADTATQRRIEDESEWLVGLGYSDPKKRNRGFDYSVGAKISSGLNPYARVRYRYKFNMPKNHFLRASQTLFWRNDDGYGTTTNLNYSHLLSLDDILEWGSTAKFTQDDEQWEWLTGVNWYHRLQNDHAIVSRAFIRGEEENPESIPEYGLNLIYRRPFLREWFFLEGLLEYRWVQDDASEPREGYLGGGLQVIMEFGHIARERLR